LAGLLRFDRNDDGETHELLTDFFASSREFLLRFLIHVDSASCDFAQDDSLRAKRQ
jgi:hypothetical protein